MNSGPVVRESFSRDHRLRKRREFEECYASGVRVSGRHVQVSLLRGASTSAARLGISVPRRVGTAVARNRVRRRLRELFRRRRPPLPGGLAVVVNARPSAALVSFQELASDFGSALERAIARLPARAVP